MSHLPRPLQQIVAATVKAEHTSRAPTATSTGASATSPWQVPQKTAVPTPSPKTPNTTLVREAGLSAPGGSLPPPLSLEGVAVAVAVPVWVLVLVVVVVTTAEVKGTPPVVVVAPSKAGAWVEALVTGVAVVLEGLRTLGVVSRLEFKEQWRDDSHHS